MKRLQHASLHDLLLHSKKRKALKNIFGWVCGWMDLPDCGGENSNLFLSTSIALKDAMSALP